MSGLGMRIILEAGEKRLLTLSRSLMKEIGPRGHTFIEKLDTPVMPYRKIFRKLRDAPKGSLRHKYHLKRLKSEAQEVRNVLESKPSRLSRGLSSDEALTQRYNMAQSMEGRRNLETVNRAGRNLDKRSS